ncbi:MAG: histidine--tRNA ligase [Halanaerobiales bacterium]
MSINAPRGTKDVLPPASAKWKYIINKAHNIFSNHNYREIKTPIFEYTNLFQRGIGEATDIVEKEMYTFTDKGGRSLTLRPEGTASVMRAFMEHKIYGRAQPTKYYYIGPMFRYERPQAGRYRQHHQIGAEVLGSNDPAVDAELISMGLNFLASLNLTDVEVYINSIGCPDCRNNYLNELKDYLIDYKDELCDDCQRRLDKNPLRILDCKNDSCSRIVKDAPQITNYLCDDCKSHFNEVHEYLNLLDIDYIIDPTLVRGLDYYTNTAFEVKYSGLGAQDTIFGGGRYNGLAREIGDRDVPGIGFALGIERLILTLEKEEIELPTDNEPDLFITTIGEKAKKWAFTFLNDLRKNNIRAEIDFLNRSVGSQMKAADRMNASYTIIIGEDELKENQATLRNMSSGKERMVSFDNLIDELQNKI